MGLEKNEQLRNFKESLLKLNEVMSRDLSKDDIILDASIQRFEFTFENAWKTIKLILKSRGLEVHSPKEAIQEAYRMGWIDDEEVFLELLESRNLTTHTYHLETAMDVYNIVKKSLNALNSLAVTLEGLLGDQNEDSKKKNE
jgi:nucleotidyltransferase substrate binding protein (TIGR01987 family)